MINKPKFITITYGVTDERTAVGTKARFGSW